MTARIPGRLRNFANGRVHWRTEAAYRKQWRAVVAALTRPWATGVPPGAPKCVLIEAAVFNRFDADGLANACKPIVDGLVDAGVLHSDGPESGHCVRYHQTVNRKARGVRITVEPRP